MLWLYRLNRGRTCKVLSRWSASNSGSHPHSSLLIYFDRIARNENAFYDVNLYLWHQVQPFFHLTKNLNNEQAN